MTKKALFPGSFDPFTAGHQAIVLRALALFDEIFIAIGVNTDKTYLFTPAQREMTIRQFFPGNHRIHIVQYSDMTVDLCHRLGIQFIVRGIRNAKDLEYEQTIAAVNHTLDPQIETILLMADNEHKDISSTLVREQLTHPKQ